MPHFETLSHSFATEIAPPPFEIQDLQRQDRVEAMAIKDFRPDVDVILTMEKFKGYQGHEDKKCQDAVIVDIETGLVAVLDGVGSTKGDKASRRAAEVMPFLFKQSFQYMKEKRTTTEVMAERVTEFLKKEGASDYVGQLIDLDPSIIQQAYQLAYTFVLTHKAVQDTKASTTLNAGLLHTTAEGRTFYIGANAGDSTAYLRRANGQVEKLTQEDSLEELALQTGVLSTELHTQMKANPEKKFPLMATEDFLRAMGYKEDQVKRFQGMSIPLTYKALKSQMSNGLGGELPPKPSLAITEVFPGDKVLLVTDGISDMFEQNTTGETDLDALGNVLEGTDDIADLNRLRETANSKTAVNKDSDDKAIVMLSLKNTAGVAANAIDQLKNAA